MQRNALANLVHLVAGTALVMAVAAGSAGAQGFERGQVVPSTGNNYMYAGSAMQCDGELLVVGAPQYDDVGHWDSGCVFVYRHDDATDGWINEKLILPSVSQDYAHFGASVAVSGSVIVVGAPDDDNTRGTNAGAVYVFRYNAGSDTWPQEQKLTASIGADNDRLAYALSLSGDVLFAGAPNSDTAAGTDSGSVYVYRYKGSFVKWVEEARLVDSAATYSNFMGQAVLVQGDAAFVGSPGTDLTYPLYDAGAVLTFNYSSGSGTWTQGATLTSSSPAGYESFGEALAREGDHLAIGAPHADAGGGLYDSGAAYVFHWDGAAWTQEWRFAPPTPTSSQLFGNSVAIDSKALVIGAAYDDTLGLYDNGSAWIARRRNHRWALDQQFSTSDAANYDHLGTQVALTETKLLIAAPGHETPTGGYDWGDVNLYPRADMNLTISPTSPPAGTDVTFSAFYGDPGAGCMLTAEDVGGVLMFYPVLIYVFGADHAMTFTATAPDPAFGLAIGFRAYRLSPLGGLVRSDLTYANL